MNQSKMIHIPERIIPAQELTLSLSFNNAAVNESCPLCGRRTDPMIGLEVMLGCEPLCDLCILKHVPEWKPLRGTGIDEEEKVPEPLSEIEMNEMIQSASLEDFLKD